MQTLGAPNNSAQVEWKTLSEIKLTAMFCQLVTGPDTYAIVSQNMHWNCSKKLNATTL